LIAFALSKLHDAPGEPADLQRIASLEIMDASRKSCHTPHRPRASGALRDSLLGKSTPWALPTATTSRITSSSRARVCGFSRIGPMGLRIASWFPTALPGTHTSAKSRDRMFPESSALMPPARQSLEKRLPSGRPRAIETRRTAASAWVPSGV
jgi:hypothetical protein